MTRFAYLLTSHLLPFVAAKPAAPPITVTNAVTSVAILYASLGIRNKPIGTVADAAGHFLPETLQLAAATDTLVVSCVGYQSRRMVVADLAPLKEAPHHGIELQPQAQALTEVVVRSSGWKRHTVGRDGT
jgi:hypothetical protein